LLAGCRLVNAQIDIHASSQRVWQVLTSRRGLFGRVILRRAVDCAAGTTLANLDARFAACHASS
jgi:hypothetical protein